MSRNESILVEQQQQPTPTSGTKRVNCCFVKFILPKEKLVELQREDGSKDQYKLVK